MSDPFTIEFGSHLAATAVRAAPDADAGAVAAALKLDRPAGLLMLAGGAGKLEGEMLGQLSPLFNTVGETVAALGMAVIDGGTQAGVMALMGSALKGAGRSVEHIGIVPADADAGEGARGKDVLDPHHTHFVLVDSDQWGGETALMYRLAEYFSAQRVPSLAVLVNGGKIALEEVKENVRQGREILVIAGSGRLADEIAVAARHPERKTGKQFSELLQDGSITIVDLGDPPERLSQMIHDRFVK